MALIAEEVVEEWLNQKGYFTIRGVRLGVNEMDILAVKFTDGQPDLRHYEVQVSINPVSYISDVPEAVQKSEGRARNSAKTRTLDELYQGVEEWVDKKFRMEKKKDLRNDLLAGSWSFYLVIHKVKNLEEIDVFEKKGIKVVHLKDVLEDLKKKKKGHFTASGKDLVDLMLMDRG